MTFLKPFTVLALLASFLFAFNVYAADPPQPGYKAETIVKTEGFVNLPFWASKTYSADNTLPIHYLPETVKNVVIEEGKDKGKTAISFETSEFGNYYINTLVDSENELHLYSLRDKGFRTGKMKAATSCDVCNCVLWVRCARASWLPYGLTYIWDKKAKIKTYFPAAGRVAVHNISYPYGHVSYVKQVSGSTIYIDEANYYSCRATSRSGTASGMSIVGYIAL